MRLLIDMDSTIFDLNSIWMEEYNRRYNDNITFEEFTKDWDFKSLINSGRVKKDTLFDILNTKGFYLRIKPYDGVVDMLHRLNDNHDILIVTSSMDGYQMTEKGEIVKKYLPFIGTGNLILCRRKELVRGDVMWDDNPKVIKSFPGITVANRFNYNKDSNPHFFLNHPLEFEDLINQMSRL